MNALLDDVPVTGAMAAADSSLVFFKRVDELGLGDLKDTFKAKGWTCFADFAFACSSLKAADPERKCGLGHRRPPNPGWGHIALLLCRAVVL